MVMTSDSESVGCEFEYSIFCFGKEKSSLISNSKYEKPNCVIAHSAVGSFCDGFLKEVKKDLPFRNKLSRKPVHVYFSKLDFNQINKTVKKRNNWLVKKNGFSAIHCIPQPFHFASQLPESERNLRFLGKSFWNQTCGRRRRNSEQTADMRKNPRLEGLLTQNISHSKHGQSTAKKRIFKYIQLSTEFPNGEKYCLDWVVDKNFFTFWDFLAEQVILLKLMLSHRSKYAIENEQFVVVDDVNYLVFRISFTTIREWPIELNPHCSVNSLTA